METIIITADGPAAGKTHLANLLTHNGKTGAILDCSGADYFTQLDVKRAAEYLRVVITGDRAADIRANRKLAKFFSARPQPIVLKIARGDDSPLVPAAAKKCPIQFRRWLLEQGNYPFVGGTRELKRLFQRLPKNPTLNDVLQLGTLTPNS